MKELQVKILLTNDDGIEAEGINALFDVFSQEYETYMIAPHMERSACSNAITVRDKLEIIKKDKNKFAVTGFPADCSNIGINGDIIPEPDIIISGINHGPNVGDDVYFSGTVAGARTAYIFGKTGIAMSLDSYHKPSNFFHDFADFTKVFIERIANIVEIPQLYNINYPDIPKNEVKGVKYTFIGKREYGDTYKTFESSNNIVVQLTGDMSSTPKAGSDITELENNFISITPLLLDHTDYEKINSMPDSKELFIY